MLQITKTYCEQLYGTRNQPANNTTEKPKIINVGSEEIPELPMEEITSALKQIRNRRNLCGKVR